MLEPFYAAFEQAVAADVSDERQSTLTAAREDPECAIDTGADRANQADRGAGMTESSIIAGHSNLGHPEVRRSAARRPQEPWRNVAR